MEHQKEFLEAMARRRGQSLHPEMMSQFQVGENEPVPHPEGEMAGSSEAPMGSREVSMEPPIPKPGSPEKERMRMSHPMTEENAHDGDESPGGSKFMQDTMAHQSMGKNSLKARAMMANAAKFKK